MLHVTYFSTFLFYSNLMFFKEFFFKLICNSLSLFHNPIVGCSQQCDRHQAGWRLSSLRQVREGEFVFIWHHLSTETKMVPRVEIPTVAGGKRIGNERSAAAEGEWVDEDCRHTCQCTWSGGHTVGAQRWGNYTRPWGRVLWSSALDKVQYCLQKGATPFQSW